MKKLETLFSVKNDFEKDGLSDFVSSLKLIPNGFGHQYNNPNATCKDRIIGDFEIIYIIDGESFITVGQKYYECGAGDLVLIPPFTRHVIQTSQSNPHDNYWLHFDVYPFYRHNDLIAALLKDKGNKVHLGLRPELVGMYEKLEDELNSKQLGGMVFFYTILTQLVTTILRITGNEQAFINPINSIYSNETNIVDRSMEFIQSNYDNKIRVGDICKALHISESYLFKAFDKILNMPPNNFILMCKIKKAEQMMKMSDLSIKEISDQMGFSSPYYFSNVFKKYYGLSPRDYMRISECCF